MFQTHSPAFAADLVGLCRDGLRDNKVAPQDLVIVYADTLTDPAYAGAFLAAAKDLGAQVFQIMEPAIATRGLSRVENRAFLNPAVLKALESSTLVIDISSGGLLYADARERILAAGSRILRVREPWDVLRRMLPDAAVRRRTLAGAAALAAGNRFHVTSAAGSDFVAERRNRTVGWQHGAADEAGRWDHWPSGMVYCAPVEESFAGRLVIDRGDLMFPPNRYVNDPIVCTIEDGHIARIEGGADAMLLREYLGRCKDAKALRLAHLGWGTEHRARWETFAIRGGDGGGSVEARSAFGNVLIGIGENRDLGGANAAPVHMDIALRRATLSLDGRVIVSDGRIAADGLA